MSLCLKVMEYAKMKSLVAEQIEHRMKQISECQDKMDDVKLTMIKATDKARSVILNIRPLITIKQQKCKIILSTINFDTIIPPGNLGNNVASSFPI